METTSDVDTEPTLAIFLSPTARINLPESVIPYHYLHVKEMDSPRLLALSLTATGNVCWSIGENPSHDHMTGVFTSHQLPMVRSSLDVPRKVS